MIHSILNLFFVENKLMCTNYILAQVCGCGCTVPLIWQTVHCTAIMYAKGYNHLWFRWWNILESIWTRSTLDSQFLPQQMYNTSKHFFSIAFSPMTEFKLERDSIYKCTIGETHVIIDSEMSRALWGPSLLFVWRSQSLSHWHFSILSLITMSLLSPCIQPWIYY